MLQEHPYLSLTLEEVVDVKLALAEIQPEYAADEDVKLTLGYKVSFSNAPTK